MRTMMVVMVLLAVAACSAEVKSPKVEVTPPKVVIGPDNPGKFCPPGQAMKGNC